MVVLDVGSSEIKKRRRRHKREKRVIFWENHWHPTGYGSMYEGDEFSSDYGYDADKGAFSLDKDYSRVADLYDDLYVDTYYGHLLGFMRYPTIIATLDKELYVYNFLTLSDPEDSPLFTEIDKVPRDEQVNYLIHLRGRGGILYDVLKEEYYKTGKVEPLKRSVTHGNNVDVEITEKDMLEYIDYIVNFGHVGLLSKKEREEIEEFKSRKR